MVAYDASPSGWPWRNVNLRTGKHRGLIFSSAVLHSSCVILMFRGRSLWHSMVQHSSTIVLGTAALAGVAI
jgi:hypothetical protein